jgi:hypothetical protein
MNCDPTRLSVHFRSSIFLVSQSSKLETSRKFRPHCSEFGTMIPHRKRYPKVQIWAGSMAQYLSLKISPFLHSHCLILAFLHSHCPKQPEKRFYAVFFIFSIWAIWAPPNGPKKVPEGQQVGETYGPMSELKNKPLTKLLGPFF